jgi:hypothetical protein
MAGLGFIESMVASLAGHAFESSIKVCPSCRNDFLLSAKACELAAFRVFQPTSTCRVNVTASVIVRGASGTSSPRSCASSLPTDWLNDARPPKKRRVWIFRGGGKPIDFARLIAMALSGSIASG